MTNPFIANRQRVTDTAGTVVLLRITSPAFPEPMCICDATESKFLDGVEYIPLPFGFKLPEQAQGSASRAKLVIDNVGRGITDYLERVGPQDLVMCKMMLCDNIEPLVVTYSINLPVNNVSVSGVLATADCGADHIMRQQGMKLRFYPHITPGVFQ